MKKGYFVIINLTDWTIQIYDPNRIPQTSVSKKKRKGIRKVGKRGKINIEVNRKLKILFMELGIRSCEVKLSGCLKTEWLSYIHRHKRREYYGKEDMLVHKQQVLLGCIPCHQKLEQDAKLTQITFLTLRGSDDL